MAGQWERYVAIGVAAVAFLAALVLILAPREKRTEPQTSFSMPAKPGPTPSSHPTHPAAPKQTTQSAPVAVAPSSSANPGLGAKAAGGASDNQPRQARHRKQTEPAAAPPARPRPATKRPATVASVPAFPHGYYVQTGAFRDIHRAERLAKRLSKSGWPVRIKIKQQGLHAVLIGPWHTRNKAMQVKNALSAKGLPGFIAHF